MTTDATISSASVKGLLSAVTQCGADAGALSQVVGLDMSQLEDPDGRVPMATMQRLWALAVQVTGDPHLDLHLAEHVHHSSYGVLAYVLMHSPTTCATNPQYQRHHVTAGFRRTKCIYPGVSALDRPNARYVPPCVVIVVLSAWAAMRPLG